MKKLFFLFQICFLFLLTVQLKSQTLTATTNCVDVTATASGVSVCYAPTNFAPCPEEQGGPYCCKIMKSPIPAQLQPSNYILYQYPNFLVQGPQSSPTFTNIAHGTYKITAQLPTREYCQGGPDFIDLYEKINGNYYYKGYKGYLALVHSNWIIVGSTVQSDFYSTLLTADPTGSWYPKETFCPDQTVYLHDGSINYNKYWIAIFENGGANRWESNYWQNGTIHNNYNGPNYNISALWNSNHPDWEFEEGLSYTVQVVIANSACGNTEWTAKELDFWVSPPCKSPDTPYERSDIQQNDEPASISIIPNPASSFLTIKNINATEDHLNYRIMIQDMLGKTVLESGVSTESVDISNIPAGSYFVSIYQSGQRIFTNKLIIQH